MLIEHGVCALGQERLFGREMLATLGDEFIEDTVEFPVARLAGIRDAVGQGKDQLDGATRSFPDIAKHYHEAGQPWIAVGDENWGEGSSREHAAMEPRFRGAKAIIVRSFARIHEANLKKQGVLALTFAEPEIYDVIGEDDRISVLGLADLQPESTVRCRITKPDGATVDFDGVQTLSPEQIDWFRAGSALNLIRQHSRGNVAITIRLLEALAVVAEQINSQDNANHVWRHAKMVYRAAMESIPEPNDREDVEIRFRIVRQILGIDEEELEAVIANSHPQL